MPRQNRVTPQGRFIATAARGTLMGNRGILHDAQGQLGTARWRHKAWVCCVLSFKNRHRAVMTPGTWTELFFLDEAVALAAGHRPCAECRRADYNRFRAAFPGGPMRAPAIDAVLHPARVTRTRTQVTHRADLAALPDGAFVDHGGPCLLHQGGLYPYAPEGYTAPHAARGTVTVLTPAPIVAALAAGYRPALHPSAG